MASSIIKKIRCNDTMVELTKKNCYFMTLTTKDVVDYEEIRQRWRNLRHWMVRKLKLRYVQNFEIHPNGHGWHVHLVVDNFIPLRQNLNKIQSFGFGRINIKKITSLGVSDYLTKHCLKAYKGIAKSTLLTARNKRMRLVNQSRGLPCLCDYYASSPFLSHIKQVRQKEKLNFRLTKRILFDLDLTYFYKTLTIQDALERLSNDIYMMRYMQ